MKTFFLALLLGSSIITFGQINTNAFNLNSSSGDLMIRRYDDGDKKWKYTFSPLGNILGINYDRSFSEGVRIYGDTQILGLLHSENYSSWGSHIGFNIYDAFDYKNHKVANYGLSRVGNNIVLAGWERLSFSTQMRIKMVLDGWGRLGIGTENPDQYLTVKGKIHAEEVIIDLNIPADYVFQKYYTGKSDLKNDYEFPKLNDVETFIKENKHLPGIPSAKEIQENGLKVGEMNNLLLQKIEELTLYIIQQEKRIEALEKNINH